ncbi:unnamed protein product, partial [Polarella glacialis]
FGAEHGGGVQAVRLASAAQGAAAPCRSTAWGSAGAVGSGIGGVASDSKSFDSATLLELRSQVEVLREELRNVRANLEHSQLRNLAAED